MENPAVGHEPSLAQCQLASSRQTSDRSFPFTEETACSCRIGQDAERCPSRRPAAEPKAFPRSLRQDTLQLAPVCREPRIPIPPAQALAPPQSAETCPTRAALRNATPSRWNPILRRAQLARRQRQMTQAGFLISQSSLLMTSLGVGALSRIGVRLRARYTGKDQED